MSDGFNTGNANGVSPLTETADLTQSSETADVSKSSKINDLSQPSQTPNIKGVYDNIDTKVFGLGHTTYKMAILDAIAAINLSSRGMNTMAIVKNSITGKEQNVNIVEIREQRIKKALYEILEMKNLGNYGFKVLLDNAIWLARGTAATVVNAAHKTGAIDAVDKAKTFGSNMLSKFTARRQGGKKRKMRKTRKNNRK